MCLQCKVKSKLNILNNVGKKKTFIRVSETWLHLKDCVLYSSDFSTLREEMIIPLSGALFW